MDSVECGRRKDTRLGLEWWSGPNSDWIFVTKSPFVFCLSRKVNNLTPLCP